MVAFHIEPRGLDVETHRELGMWYSNREQLDSVLLVQHRANWVANRHCYNTLSMFLYACGVLPIDRRDIGLLMGLVQRRCRMVNRDCRDHDPRQHSATHFHSCWQIVKVCYEPWAYLSHHLMARAVWSRINYKHLDCSSRTKSSCLVLLVRGAKLAALVGIEVVSPPALQLAAVVKHCCLGFTSGWGASMWAVLDWFPVLCHFFRACSLVRSCGVIFATL